MGFENFIMVGSSHACDHCSVDICTAVHGCNTTAVHHGAHRVVFCGTLAIYEVLFAPFGCVSSRSSAEA